MTNRTELAKWIYNKWEEIEHSKDSAPEKRLHIDFEALPIERKSNFLLLADEMKDSEHISITFGEKERETKIISGEKIKSSISEEDRKPISRSEEIECVLYDQTTFTVFGGKREEIEVSVEGNGGGSDNI